MTNTETTVRLSDKSRLGDWRNHGGTYDWVSAPTDMDRRWRAMEDAIAAFGGDVYDIFDVTFAE